MSDGIQTAESVTCVTVGSLVLTPCKLECIQKVSLADVLTDNTCDFMGAVGIPMLSSLRAKRLESCSLI
jgi:hypothetical protein